MATRKKKAKTNGKAKPSPVSNQPCHTTNCPNNAFYKQAMLCKACYSGHYYWLKKSVTERVKRQRKLVVLSSRMDDLIS